MGRPTECTKERTQRICEALALGVTMKAAAAAGSVSLASVMEWRRRGGEGEEPYATFLEATTRARDAAEVAMAQVVFDAAKAGDVSASCWWLSRIVPERWGNKSEVAVTTHTTVSPADLKAAYVRHALKADAPPLSDADADD